MRKRVWRILEGSGQDRAGRTFQVFILSLIGLNIVAAVASTVRGLDARWTAFFHWFEVASVAVFTIEYLSRVWSCVEDPACARPVAGRLRFMRTPMAVVDLLAILPFYIAFLSVDLRTLRILRLTRIFRIAKVGRYSASIRLLGRVLRGKKEELVLTAGIMTFLLVIASSVMYYAENDAQPDKFPDIPSTMWWAIVTMTTVGYGDVFPATGLGKILGGIIAVLGIGMLALPTGILGAGFVEELQRGKTAALCPHCGKRIDGEAAGGRSTGPENDDGDTGAAQLTN